MSIVNKRKTKGFTLAEVLLTLTIIGIITGLTLPVLINNIQEQQYKIAWKKEYSVFSRTANSIIADYGSLKGLTCDIIQDTCIKNYFNKYLVDIVEENDRSRGKCWHENNEWINMQGNTMKLGDGHDACLALNDGTLVNFEHYYTSCPSQNCGFVYIDVNGYKRPNQVGKDIYRFYLSPDRIRTESGNCDSSTIGWGCSTQNLLN